MQENMVTVEQADFSFFNEKITIIGKGYESPVRTGKPLRRRAQRKKGFSYPTGSLGTISGQCWPCEGRPAMSFVKR